MKLVTKTGDQGFTSLVGGERTAKYNERVEAYGTVDELSAVLGCCFALGLPEPWGKELENIQRDLFLAAADLASEKPGKDGETYLKEENFERLEKQLEPHLLALPAQHCFILNGGSPVGAHLHLARTVCRRAERRVAVLGAEEQRAESGAGCPGEVCPAATVYPIVLKYLNRLSDYLFAAARLVNRLNGCPEKEV